MCFNLRSFFVQKQLVIDQHFSLCIPYKGTRYDMFVPHSHFFTTSSTKFSLSYISHLLFTAFLSSVPPLSFSCIPLQHQFYPYHSNHIPSNYFRLYQMACTFSFRKRLLHYPSTSVSEKRSNMRSSSISCILRKIHMNYTSIYKFMHSPFY